MANLKLTDVEGATLKEVLDAYVSDLSMEIADTDRYEYREEIKARRELIRGIVGMLERELAPHEPLT